LPCPGWVRTGVFHRSVAEGCAAVSFFLFFPWRAKHPKSHTRFPEAGAFCVGDKFWPARLPDFIGEGGGSDFRPGRFPSLRFFHRRLSCTKLSYRLIAHRLVSLVSSPPRHCAWQMKLSTLLVPLTSTAVPGVRLCVSLYAAAPFPKSLSPASMGICGLRLSPDTGCRSLSARFVAVTTQPTFARPTSTEYRPSRRCSRSIFFTDRCFHEDLVVDACQVLICR